MKNNEQSVTEIRAAMDKWTEALRRKDIEAMHENYADQYCMFDVKDTVYSVAGAKELWAQCFPYFDDPQAKYKDLVIHASDDMAVVHFKSQIEGLNVPMPEEMKQAWLRGTVCFRKIDGVWKCVHEHISFPVDCEKNEIVYSE